MQRSASEADVAERKFGHALGLARERGEKSLQLRAAMSLARLLASRGGTSEARAVLTPSYEWFTEDFDTADLIAAKALLAPVRASQAMAAQQPAKRSRDSEYGGTQTRQSSPEQHGRRSTKSWVKSG
jgi:hypothetical protein